MNLIEKMNKYLIIKQELDSLYLKQKEILQKIKTLSIPDRESINTYFFLKNNQYIIDEKLEEKVILLIKDLNIKDIYNLQLTIQKQEQEKDKYYDNYRNFRHVVFTILQEKNLNYTQFELSINIPIGIIDYLLVNGKIYENYYIKLCNALELDINLFRWKENYTIPCNY